MNNKILKLYFDLREKYGSPEGQWQLWRKRPKTLKEKEEILIGAILTQRTNWRNVELAMSNLKKAKINSLAGIYKLGEKKLAEFIKPSGFYRQKAKYLFGLAEFVVNRGGLRKIIKEPTDKLRKEFLDLKGVGPETADSILLYALERPVFVIDEYTRRLIKSKLYEVRLRKIQSGEFSYEKLQKLFEQNLKQDWRLYQDFHALIVIDAKT